MFTEHEMEVLERCEGGDMFPDESDRRILRKLSSIRLTCMGYTIRDGECITTGSLTEMGKRTLDNVRELNREKTWLERIWEWAGII